MIDSNLQREKILSSEKTFAYKMKLEALKRPAAVQVVFKQAQLHPYFPPSYTTQQMEEVIVSLL